jgi:hypothetical protein
MRTQEKRLAAFAAGVVAAACCGQVALARPAFASSSTPAHTVRHATAVESTVYNFLGPTADGGGGDSALVEDAAGNIYGTTYFGGAFSCGSGFPDCGTVFKLAPAPSGGYTESVIWNFQPGQGVAPVSVILDASGNLYGVTQNTNEVDNTPGGTVFKLSPGPSGYTFTLLHAFTGGSDGAYPASTLGLDKGGDIYGTTELGGSGNCVVFGYPSGCGTAFELKPSGSTYIYQQTHAYQGGTDGAFPTGPVLVQPGGIILATTAGTFGSTGSDSGGTISALYHSGQGFFNITLYVFGSQPHGLGMPMGGVIEDSHLNLFGTAIAGGSGPGQHAGGVFELSMVHNRYTKQRVLYSFNYNARRGAYPSTGVVADSAGNLYGATPIDHNSHYSGGTVFELSPTTGNKYVFTELNNFSNPLVGDDPVSVTLGSDGALYGTTFAGGPDNGDSHSGNGVVFKITL